eukprot:TRINITY_DN18220_c0_g1_i1.p1 TRINITY_DN18220_c0_g1~~TRINITY_DN18220_c0_g1_i1.p1  ORF type:complete len:737 (+),score=221.50 TRINITY_DN18220_c0_g1_i1:100-2310(+)
MESLNSSRTMQIAVTVLFYTLSGPSLVIVNKTILRDRGLHMPALVSSMGLIFMAVLMQILVKLGKVEVKTEVDVKKLLPVGIFTAGGFILSNMAYDYLAVGLIQCLKAGTPAILLIMLAAFKIERLSFRSVVCVLTMVMGGVLTGLEAPTGAMNWIGLMIMVGSEICEGARCVSLQVYLQNLNFSVFDAGYWIAPVTAGFILLVAAIFEVPAVVRSGEAHRIMDCLPLILASGMLGICVNFSSYLLIKLTSGIYAKLLVQARNAGLVLFCILMGERYTNLEVLSYVITLIAFCAYSIIQVNKPKEAPVEPYKAVETVQKEDGEKNVEEGMAVPLTAASEVETAAEEQSAGSKMPWRTIICASGMTVTLLGGSAFVAARTMAPSTLARFGLGAQVHAQEVSVAVGAESTTLDSPAMPEAQECLDKEWSKLMDRVEAECKPAETLKYTTTGVMVNIHRGQWGQFSRGYDKYLQRFRRNIKAWSMQDNLAGVFLVDKAAKEAAEEEIAELSSEQASRFCLIELALDEMPHTVCLHDKFSEALETQKKNTPHTLPAVIAVRTEPEFSHAHYNEIMQVKAGIFLWSGKRNPYKSDVVASIDLGTHVVNLLDEHKKYGDFKFKDCDDKVCLEIRQCGRLQRMHETYEKDFWSIALDGNGVLVGGTITGSPKACERALPAYQNTVLKLLEEGFCQDDQPYWVRLALLQPDLVSLLDTPGAGVESWAAAYRQIESDVPAKTCEL